MEFKIDKGTGYMYCYNPNHPLANKAGKVMEHVLVMVEAIGRPLKQGECVHHINRDKTDNSIENLRLMTISEHALLHQMEDNGYLLSDRTCLICSSKFTASSGSAQKYCSYSCSFKARKRFDISREDLYRLVWTTPTVEVAKILGISDVAVGKRCKKLNIPKPSRGFWAKVQAGKDVEIPPLPE